MLNGKSCGCGCDSGKGGLFDGFFGNEGFLLLLLLFILLADGNFSDDNFIFIIILAIIAFGGFENTFGLFK